MWKIVVACGLDLVLGDPQWLPHPVVGMGKLIDWGEGLLRPRVKNELLAGALLTAGVTLTTLLATVLLLRFIYRLDFLLGELASILLLYYCFSLRSLEQAGQKIHQCLQEGNIHNARREVSYIVGRDTEGMEEKEIIRAAVESIAENSVDGFLAPFFFAFLGGAPLALLYKSINTLDSMIGYKNEQYLRFGRAAARLDDMANYLPARLLYILLPAAAGLKRMADTLNIIARDGRRHPSPNSGLAEAGFAGALGIQLGGENRYRGQINRRPLLGDAEKILERKDVLRAINLMYRLAIALICGAAAITFLVF